MKFLTLTKFTVLSLLLLSNAFADEKLESCLNEISKIREELENSGTKVFEQVDGHLDPSSISNQSECEATRSELEGFRNQVLKAEKCEKEVNSYFSEIESNFQQISEIAIDFKREKVKVESQKDCVGEIELKLVKEPVTDLLMVELPNRGSESAQHLLEVFPHAEIKTITE